MELQPITPTTLARSREDEECRQLDRPVDDEPREIKLSVARPRDMPRDVMRRVRPPSISGNSDHPQIISPEDISLDPCTVGEETPLEEGSFLAFDTEDEHPGIDTANEESKAVDVEKKLDDTLKKGDFDAIVEQLTPKNPYKL